MTCEQLCYKYHHKWTKYVLIEWIGFFFFFLVFHQLADDEAHIIFLQTSLFLVFPYAVDNRMPLSSKSSLIADWIGSGKV